MPYGAGEGVNRLGQFIMGMVNGGKATNGPDPSFGQRLSAGTLSAVEGYDQFSDQQDRINSAGKAADYFRKSMGEDAEKQTGITDAEWQNLGAREKAAAAQGFVENQTAQSMAARIKDTLSQVLQRQGTADWRTSQANKNNQETTSDQTFADAYKRATQPATPDWRIPQSLTASLMSEPNANGGQPTPQSILTMALQSGVTLPKALTYAQSLKSISAGSPNGDEPFKPSGNMLKIGKWNVPVIQTGPKESNPNWSLATDENGNPALDKSKLTPAQAMRQFSQNQKDLALINQRLQLAPAIQKVSGFDPDELRAQHQALSDEQDELGPIWNKNYKSNKGPSATPAKTGATPKPTPADIQYLRSNPTSAMAANFNGRFGAGAADRFLP